MEVFNFENIVNSIIFEGIDETNRIQRIKPFEKLKKGQKSYNMMPIKQAEVDDAYFDTVDKEDDEYRKKFNLTKQNYKSRRDPLTFPKGKEVKELQQDLTQKVQQRATEKNGSKYVSPDNFTTDSDVKKKDKTKIVVSQKIKDELSENGFELEIKGKTFVYGNTKLPNSTMIVNLTSAMNCPSLDVCKLYAKFCYAKKSNDRYHDQQLRDIRNELTFPYLTPREILKLVETYIERSKIRIKRIRISEDGDFKSQEQVKFIDKLAGHIYAKYGIRTVAYTNSRFDFTECQNLIVNASSPLINGADRNYLAKDKEFFDTLEYGGIKERIDKKGELEKYFKCHCNCKLCDFCYRTKAENGENEDERINVYCELH